jgi:hypothetical protein
MAVLTLRLVKGTPLTNAEVDNNFSNINSEVGVVGGNVGILSNLLTGTKANVVNAVNELYANVGVLSNLTTTTKSNVVSAVNEVKSSVTSSAIVFAIALG